MIYFVLVSFVSPLKMSDKYEEPIVIMKMSRQVCNDCMNIWIEF